MSIATEITRLQNAKAALKTAINAKGGTIVDETLDAYAGFVDILEIGGGGSTPSTGSQNIFTGATIPLTYKDNTHTYENTYIYKSATHNITIAGLDGRATITGNGTKEVTVAFDVTSATSSLKNFTITCDNGIEPRDFTGMHAHYGTTVTGILTFAYKNSTHDGSEGTIGTNYLFIESSSTELPYYDSTVSSFYGVYSYQVLNLLIGNYTSNSIASYFLQDCYSFNQPLVIPSGVTQLWLNFMYNCYSFNQPIDLNNVINIGSKFMNYCYAFNQPIDLNNVVYLNTYFMNYCYSFNQPLRMGSVDVFLDYFMCYCYSFNQPIRFITNNFSIGSRFMNYCYAFNQPIDLNNVVSIGTYFLRYCYAFNQPIDLNNVVSIGTYFMSNCDALSFIIWNVSVYPTDINSLSQSQNTKTSTSGSGIVVYGTKRAELMAALPDRTSSPYRKLINGGA